MATTIAGVVNLSTPRVLAKIRDSAKAQPIKQLNSPWNNKRRTDPTGRRMYMQTLSLRVRATPEQGISEKVEKSIKGAEEACEENPASGECVAAWDEVEELSAAASHARDKKKDSDPLETYCKDNPETDECRTYED